MKLRTDWKSLVLRAWSIRLNVLAALFMAAEVAMNFLAAKPPVSPGAFAVIAFAVTLGANWARLVQQKGITPEDVQ